MKNKIGIYFSLTIFCLVLVFGIFSFPVTSYAFDFNYPSLVRILNYYSDSDGRITFKWQQDYMGCSTSSLDCFVGLQLSTLQFSSNGGEGFYNTDGDFGSNWGFMNFTTTCNELMSSGRICISHPKILINRNNNAIMASNGEGLLYSDVVNYVGPGKEMHTIFGGIFRTFDGFNNNWWASKVNHISFGDVELEYTPPVSLVKNPVLIVPGLMGTEMKRNLENLWVNPAMTNPINSDSFMDPLQFSFDLKPVDSQVAHGNIVKSIQATINGITFTFYDYAGNLTQEFIDSGYIENHSLFTLPYDWRYGVTGKYPDGKTNADLLAQKIEEILQQTGAQKVDVVAHSMGGLIVKQYALNHVSDNNIGKAVFVGVPSTGAPKSIKALLQGDNLDVFGLSDAEIKKISQNMPAIYDLLPSQQYYDAKGSFVKIYDQGSLTDIHSAEVKDLNYQEFSSFLTADHGLNSLALTNAQSLHTESFDNFDMRTAGIDMYAIDGCKAGTLGTIVENRFKNIFGQSMAEYKTPKFTPGDGTVPLESATNLPIDAAKKYYSLAGVHSKLMSQDGTRQQIVNILSGGSLSVDGDLVTQDISRCELNGKAISVFSPVDVYVTDQYGNKLGLAEDGSVFNEIPNADFQVWGEHKFMYLPTDDGQVYDIQMKGTGTGTYTIKTDDIENNDVVKTQTFNDLPVTSQLTGSIYFGADGAKDYLEVKQTSVSQPEMILPSPPEAVIQFDLETKDLKFSATEPNVTVTDADDMITLIDQVGDVAKLQLKDKQRKKAMQAEIKLLQYNGVNADISKTVLKFAWNYNKLGNLEKLVQQVKSKGSYVVTAEFDSKTNTTKIEGRDGSGKIKRVESGLKIINITTNKGDFDWSY